MPASPCSGADKVPRAGHSSDKRHPYLPALTWLLLIAITVWFINYFVFERPSTERQLRMESFMAALRLIPEHYVKEVKEEDLYRAAMEGMVSSLGDRYSAYLGRPQMGEARIQTSGEFGGIGVSVAPQDGLLVITEVMESSPARQVGLAEGDMIVKVDGQECSKLPFPEAVALVRGKVGTPVELAVMQQKTGQTVTFNVVRRKITLETVKWEMLESDLGLLRVEQFDQHSLAKIKDGIDALLSQGMRGLILDLRNNTGGLLDQAVAVSDLFLDRGAIVKLESRLTQERDSFKASEGTALPQDMPLVVLVDGRTASAAEIVAGALKQHGRATIIGTRTFGKGAVNKIYPLPDGSGVILTVAHYSIPPDTVIEGSGIEPDIVVGELPPFPSGSDRKEVAAWIAEQKRASEQQLERARMFLREKIQ